MSEQPGHDHDHDHDHPHPQRPDQDDTMTYYRVMEMAVRELLIEKGMFTADEVRAEVEMMDARLPANGAKVVARAWVDPDFKARLLEDSKTAIESIGGDIGPSNLIVVENTAQVHNVVVCTLCSCYPRWLLGLPPDWYKSRAYRARAVREPRAVLAEFGTQIADNREVRVHDSTADMRYLVLPIRPAGTEAMDEAALADIITRDSMIGVIEVPTP